MYCHPAYLTYIVKFRISGRRDDPVDEASANPKTKEEVLYEWLADRWNEENVSPVKNVDVMFGNPSDGTLKDWMDEIFEEFEFITQAGVVFVTDSAHIGFGTVFERDGKEAVVVEEYDGYEGANGEDVSGMIHEDYRIRVDASWLW